MPYQEYIDPQKEKPIGISPTEVNQEFREKYHELMTTLDGLGWRVASYIPSMVSHGMLTLNIGHPSYNQGVAMYECLVNWRQYSYAAATDLARSIRDSENPIFDRPPRRSYSYQRSSLPRLLILRLLLTVMHMARREDLHPKLSENDYKLLSKCWDSGAFMGVYCWEGRFPQLFTLLHQFRIPLVSETEAQAFINKLDDDILKDSQ